MERGDLNKKKVL